ncbi:hypothetical protein EYF80_049477 [Liparis tanakae]|uniref:Uncharacterized protein n=1 Tax=Liparis tanakae TaxID=230148 RepID=A0A4Z2FHY0_9TELE|nr:hypothetical protein EYF80_049477 [Liparis tanakae]
MVLDGSSACVCVSEGDGLVRQSGVASAGSASASIIIRTGDGVRYISFHPITINPAAASGLTD